MNNSRARLEMNFLNWILLIQSVHHHAYGFQYLLETLWRLTDVCRCSWIGLKEMVEVFPCSWFYSCTLPQITQVSKSSCLIGKLFRAYFNNSFFMTIPVVHEGTLLATGNWQKKLKLASLMQMSMDLLVGNVSMNTVRLLQI